MSASGSTRISDVRALTRLGADLGQPGAPDTFTETSLTHLTSVELQGQLPSCPLHGSA